MLKERVLNTVNRLYREGEHSYVLANYVKRDFWFEKVQQLFSDNYVENATDFNYSTCFTTYITVSDVQVSYYSKSFDEYLKKDGSVHYIGLEISAIAPYATFKYYYVTLEGGQRKICSSYTPFSKNDVEFGRKINDFLSQEQITLLQDHDLLTTIVPGVSRELRTDDVTVYHCLFTDGDFGPDAI